MVDMVAAAALAERLINANGRTVTLIQHGQDPLNRDQPWRGQAVPIRAQVLGVGVFTTSSQFQGDTGRQYLLFAANDDGGYALEEFDEVLDDGVSWKIVSTGVLQPGALRLLYEFEVE